MMVDLVEIHVELEDGGNEEILNAFPQATIEEDKTAVLSLLKRIYRDEIKSLTRTIKRDRDWFGRRYGTKLKEQRLILTSAFASEVEADDLAGRRTKLSMTRLDEDGRRSRVLMMMPAEESSESSKSTGSTGSTASMNGLTDVEESTSMGKQQSLVEEDIGTLTYPVKEDSEDSETGSVREEREYATGG